MADKRITDVDFISSLASDESFFVNQNNTLKQINKGDVTFGIVNGGTGANNAADALINLGVTNCLDELRNDIESQLNTHIQPISHGGTGATTAIGALNNLGINIDGIQVVNELPSDAANHPNTLYLVTG